MSGNRQAGQRGTASRGGGAGGSGGGAGRGAAGRGAAGRSASARGADRPAAARPARQAGRAGRGPAGSKAAGRGTTARSRRPLPRGQALYTPGAPAWRQAIERRSAALLVYLHQLPRWVPAAVLVGLLIAGLALSGIPGGIALAALALVLAWLAVVSWPSLSPAGRTVRTLVIALVIAAAVVQVVR